MANLALGDHYQKDISGFRNPEFVSMSSEKGKVTLNFKNIEAGINTKSGAPLGFMIAGSDRKWVPASARIEGSKVVINVKKIQGPFEVRYGFSNAGIGNVFNSAGLPLVPFRTDHWEE